MQKFTNLFCLVALATIVAFTSIACETVTSSNPGTGGDKVAATVNSKRIMLEQVERSINQQLGAQRGRLSPLEVQQLRLQALENMIQKEVLYQRAERDKLLPTEEEVTQAINRNKAASQMTSEEYDRKLKEAGETEQSLRDIAKRDLAIQKLIDNVANKVAPPTDKEVEDFYNSNKEQFVKKRGASFAAIVVDPSDSGQGDPTKNEAEAQMRLKEIAQKMNQPGADFADLVRTYSEDPATVARSGDWRAFTEDEMKQLFSPQAADFIMNKMQVGQIFPQAVPLEGRFLVLKLRERNDKDETLTLETPGVRQQVVDLLNNARKQVLNAAYVAVALDEAKIENFLAKDVISNPNNFGVARPAEAQTAASPVASSAASPAALPAASPAVNANAAK